MFPPRSAVGTPAGLEPAIPDSVGRCLIRWATGPLRRDRSNIATGGGAQHACQRPKVCHSSGARSRDVSNTFCHYDSGKTRTCDPQPHMPMPYPLGHKRLRFCLAPRARRVLPRRPRRSRILAGPSASAAEPLATWWARAATDHKQQRQVWGSRPCFFRNGALSHRLKPLGQNDLRIGALCFPHDASRVAERSMTNPNPLLGRLKPGWQSMGKGKSCGLAPTPLRNGTLSRRRSRAQFASREAHQASTHEGAPLRDFTTESQNSIRRCPTRSGARSPAVSNTRYHYDPGRT